MTEPPPTAGSKRELLQPHGASVDAKEPPQQQPQPQQRLHDDDQQQEEEDVWLEQLYNDLIKRSCIDVACQMHRRFKTSPNTILYYNNNTTSSDLSARSRRYLYPTLYQTDAQVQEKLEYYATTCVPESQTTTKTNQESRCIREDVTVTPEQEADEHYATTTTTTTTRKAQQQQQDIWGKIPLKEDPLRLALCHVCGRRVGTLRFASHLDKCMGLGATTRTAATHATTTTTS